MNRAALIIITLALSSAAFAGCLGTGDDIETIPRAVVKVTPTDEKDTFVFDATGSSGKGLKFEWSFGDGTTGTEAKETHTYTYGDGNYPAELIITDLKGVSDRWAETISVGSGTNLPPTAAFTPAARQLAIGEPLTVDASATLDPEGDPIRYEWDFNAVMTKDQYIAFKDKKLHQDELPAEEETEVSGGGDGKSAKALPDPQRMLDDPETLTQKSPGSHSGGGHGADGEWDISLFEGRRTATTPVYTLESGFPEPAVYVVLLTAYDVKSATREILSQDAWAVEVTDAKKKQLYTPTTTGNLTFGSQSSVTETTPDGDQYRDQDVWDFTVPDPVVSMFLNVTWTQNAVYESTGQVNSDVDIVVVAPDAKEYKALGPDDQHTISLNLTDVPSGKWTVNILGRQGFDIDYEVKVWAKVDVNPFRDIEKDHH